MRRGTVFDGNNAAVRVYQRTARHCAGPGAEGYANPGINSRSCRHKHPGAHDCSCSDERPDAYNCSYSDEHSSGHGYSHANSWADTYPYANTCGGR